jgi:3-oxoacyl-[acyl-carrier-protein] synthase-3
MGFNGEVLVGRGEAFSSALNQFWNWEEEVLTIWPVRDSWRAVHVRTPAVGDQAERSWWDYSSAAEASAAGALAMRQNIALLPQLTRLVAADYGRLAGEGRFDPAAVRWYAAHYSSERLKTSLLQEMAAQAVPTMPAERWYSNLTRVGNIGSVAIFVILEEILTTGLVAPGDQILCMVPESGRFTVSHILLTAVGPDGSAS